MNAKAIDVGVQAGASMMGKLSAERRLGHLTQQQRSEWGRRLGQIWRDRKEAEDKAANRE